MWGNRDEDSQGMCKPTVLPSTLSTIKQKQAFLIDTGDELIFYIGFQVEESLLQSLFQCEHFQDLKYTGNRQLAYFENNVTTRITSLIETIRNEKGGAFQNLKVVLSA